MNLDVLKPLDHPLLDVLFHHVIALVSSVLRLCRDPSPSSMASQYRLRLATEDDAEAMVRTAVAAFGASGNNVDTRIFPEHLRTPTSYEDRIELRTKITRPTLNRNDFPDRWTILAVCDGKDGKDEIAGYAHWQAPSIVDGKLDGDNTKNLSADERLKKVEDRSGGFPSYLDQAAMKEFMELADKFMKDTLGDEGDKNMWSKMLSGFEPF